MTSYPGFEGQKNLGQKEDEALHTNGHVFQDKVSDAHRPNQIEEIEAVQVRLGKYEAVKKMRERIEPSVERSNVLAPRKDE